MPKSKSNYRRKCLGVSYILSVLVMTVVTVSLSSVVLFWALRTVDETQIGFTNDVQSRMDKTRERFVVESVLFENSTHLTVFVRNVGGIQLIVDQVYIDNQAGTPTGILIEYSERRKRHHYSSNYIDCRYYLRDHGRHDPRQY